MASNLVQSNPVRIQVCNYDGSCVPISPGFTLSITGSVIELSLHHVDEFIEAVHAANDELLDEEDYSDEPLIGS